MTAAAGGADARVPGYLGRVLDENGDPVGTCFQVARGVLVTAWHVLDAIGAAEENARVRIDPLAGGEVFDAAVKRLNPQRDLAVLTSAGGLPAVTGPLAATDQVPLRVTVTVTGHVAPDDPGQLYRFLDAPGEWGGGTIRDEVVPLGRMTSSDVVPGMSGGPVICDSDGAVAGVVSGRYNSADGWLAGTVWVARTEDLAVLLDGIAKVTMRQAAAQALPGWPLAEVGDPFVLEVHQPVQPEDLQPGLPVLPAYVPREHDAELGSVVRAAADGSSGIAVLVGGSSTGKTRACWEALGLLRDGSGLWRLWHPIDPSRPEAALRELPTVGPRTVVWLNEAQLYLDGAGGGLGERVAAGLRELLRDPARAPVLVLATLWPEYWHGLTARLAGGADPHAQARELLDGHDITVPAAFTPAQLQQLDQAGDARLAQAAAGAQDGQVIQFLAGAPELLARYRHAPPAAAALISAAMDARRLGTDTALPRAFLEAAAPGYLTDTEWDALDDDWLEQALAYTAETAKGVRGPLTRIRPRPARSGAGGPGSRDSDKQPADGQPRTQGGPLYRLADYLDQHGRTERTGRIPPAGFWAAAADYASPADQAALGDAAAARGLYRDAAQLFKNAARRGNPRAVTYLTEAVTSFTSIPCLGADVRPLGWAGAHVSLDDPGGVASLLAGLREAGADEQAAALLRRDPAAHVSLESPVIVARLLDALREAGADEQAAALLRRDPAAHVSLENPGGVAFLLGSLRKAGADEQVTGLADRAAAHASLDDPGGVDSLLAGLREAGADEQAAALLRRDPAAHVSLESPVIVARLLDALREAGADEQAAALLRRDPAAHVSLENPYEVVDLLAGLREAGADEQAAALADRAAAHASVETPGGVASLLVSLMRSGTLEQVTTLADRAAAHASVENSGDMTSLLDAVRAAGLLEPVTALLRRDPAAQAALEDPDGVARLLASLRTAATPTQVTALADRAATHASLEDPGGVASLLAGLREAGADEQAAALLARDPAAHVSLEDPGGVASLLAGLREAGADEQAAALLARDPAAHVSLEDSDGMASLLAGLREAGADEQAAALAGRIAADAPLENPGDVVRLLRTLREVGADEQVTVLADRAAAHAPLEYPWDVAILLDRLQEAGADEQAAALLARDPAAHASLEDPGGVGSLLYSLQSAGAQEQAAVLLARDPAAHVAVDDPGGVTFMLGSLREAGADEQVTALADRAAAHAPLDNPRDVAGLLGTLWDSPEQVAALLRRDPAAHVAVDDPGGVARLLDQLLAHGAPEQVAVLLRRDPAAHASLAYSDDVASLLDKLREAGADEQVTGLTGRLPGAGMFELFRRQRDPQDQFRFGREADGSPAKPWDWGDLD